MKKVIHTTDIVHNALNVLHSVASDKAAPRTLRVEAATAIMQTLGREYYRSKFEKGGKA